MNKNDIKIGMVVETRDGDFYLIKEREGDIILAGKDAFITFSSYSDELKWCLNGKEHLLDIVKIYKCDAYSIDTLFDKEYLTLLWERQRNKVSFSEAFEAFEEGKEIESRESGYKYCNKEGKCYIQPQKEKNWLEWVEGTFELDEIRGKWYIN